MILNLLWWTIHSMRMMMMMTTMMMMMMMMMIIMLVVIPYYPMTISSPRTCFLTFMPEGDDGMTKILKHEKGHVSLSRHPRGPFLCGGDGYSCGLSVNLLCFVLNEERGFFGSASTFWTCTCARMKTIVRGCVFAQKDGVGGRVRVHRRFVCGCFI
mmetsp:Transcript_3320/g.5008  ORF Transcript_3320/g.5008 Transcript_3320/m.5008 type:complete len:156 (-) Transcript_3320:153-620(-)